MTFAFSTEVARGNTTFVIPDSRYTPTPADRGGFQVRCVDTGNPNWRTISLADIELSTDILPRCKLFLNFAIQVTSAIDNFSVDSWYFSRGLIILGWFEVRK